MNKTEFENLLSKSLTDFMYNTMNKLATAKDPKDLITDINKDSLNISKIISEYIDNIKKDIELNNIDTVEVNTEDKKNKIEGKGNTNKTGKLGGKK